jgi:drug/metabolite transporter (DMT)-like permease
MPHLAETPRRANYVSADHRQTDSLMYLPLSDATVITFLSPVIAGYGCHLLIGEPFTRTEQIASYVSLFGVILISRPTSFHSGGVDPTISPPLPGPSNTTSNGYDFPVPTSQQRLGAIAVAMLGVCGTAVALTVIRWIGKRAHPILSVTYFAVWCAFVSTVVLATASHLPAPFTSPHLHFALPASPRQWAMLFFLGTCGFIMQFLMTAGLAHEKSNRATNMVYTSMLFALLWDRWVFGTVPGMWSLLGSGLILGSAIYVAVQKVAGHRNRISGDVEAAIRAEEESVMLGDVDGLGEFEGVPLIEINGDEQDDINSGRSRDGT